MRHNNKSGNLVTAKVLGELLGGVSYPTVMRWAAKGLIPSVKVGWLRRFDPKQVLESFEGGSSQREGDKLKETEIVDEDLT